MNIKWIFFDVGGVLADESQFFKIRQDCDFEAVKYFQPETKREEILLAWQQVSRIVKNLDKLDEEVITLVLKNKNKVIEAIEFMKTKRDNLPKYYDLLKVREGAIDVISQLSKKYKLGILANQNIKAREVLQKSGILSYFNDSSMSDDFKLSKPNPEFFKKVFEITGANPTESVMVDDNIEKGLSPAKKLGMTTIWYKLEDRNDIPMNIVNYTVTSFKELLIIL